jgi:uncharacterized protein (DUF1330 family)
MNAYLILDLSIKDFESFKEYIEKIPIFIQKYHGRYIVQGVEPEVMEGDWKPERVVVIEFPSKEGAKNFLDDPEARALFDIRHKSTTSKLLLVEGCL